MNNKYFKCLNDYSNIDNVIVENISIKKCFQEIKCQILAFINLISVEFLKQNIDTKNIEMERNKLNTLIESLISGIHQAVKTPNGKIKPYFQLWIQNETSQPTAASCSDTSYKNESTCTANSETWTAYVPAEVEYSLGAGWIDGDKASGCYDDYGNPTIDLYGTCTRNNTYTWVPQPVITPGVIQLASPEDQYGCFDTYGNSTNDTVETCTSIPKTWNGVETDLQYDAGNLPILYPNKISLNINCSKGIPNEIIYLHIPTFQFVFNPKDSSLKLKLGEVSNIKNSSKTCLFPILSDDQKFKSQVLDIVPPSYDAIGDNDDSEVWDNPINAHKFIRDKIILKNTDLRLLISKIDKVIRKCHLANSNLNQKKLSLQN